MTRHLKMQRFSLGWTPLCLFMLLSFSSSPWKQGKPHTLPREPERKYVFFSFFCSNVSVNVGVRVYSLCSRWLAKAPTLLRLQNSSIRIGSPGHVLGHSLPYFILQVCQSLPVCLQLQPLVVWHLKEDIQTDLITLKASC